MPELSKERVLTHCKKVIDAKIKELTSEIAKVEESAANETKSSMGDKYETGREMIMQEKTKLNEQMQTLIGHKTSLELVDQTLHSEIKLGSLVSTNQATFFIVSAIGNLSIEGKQVFVISQLAPLSREMLGKKNGEVILFNGKKQTILKVS